ncbi:Ankyrin-2 [Portunus trituberculatus]|uniref:Ankyrin-2 n=1 Tax=Portunus trituberculatus TaxID=210409 RepID=A0A5B7CN26_PORTR|nr:Ankyrin-2 [Portunus trituberculatus]
MEITSEKCHSNVLSTAEPNEIKIRIREATVITQDTQTKQGVTSFNFMNGYTDQKVLSPESDNKSPDLGSVPSPSRHREDSTAIDLRKHIASLNKVSLEFGKNKKHKGDKNAAESQDPLVSPEQHSTPPAIHSATASNTKCQASREVGKQNEDNVKNPSVSHGVGARFCLATALENTSLPIYKGGEAMLRPLSYSNASPQRKISARDLLYTDKETQQSSLLHVDTLMRLKTDNLMARHGGKTVHLHSYPPSPHQASPIPDQTPIQEDTIEVPPLVESLPPIPPKTKPASVSRQTSTEDAGAKSPPISQAERKCSSRKASGHWTRSRNVSLDHPSSRRGSKRPSFSQDMLRKCLMVAVDQCYNNEWEESHDNEVMKESNLSQEELNKSLVKAVSHHDAEKVRVVLKLGADPNVKCGSSPALLRATRDGALYVLQALLAAGADVDGRTDLGNSPLHLAARGGYGEAIVQLVHSGAFVDAINRSGVTPLQMALAHGHVEVAQTLLRFNADMFLQNKVGETAYDVANQLGYIGLVSGAPREIRRDSGVGTKVETPSNDIPVAVRMIQGIEIGCAGTVDDCLRQGASPNTLLPLALHWPARASVLHRAAHHGHDLIVRLLLAAGADINLRDVVGNTSLHVAAQAGHNRVVKILLECGAPLEAVSQSGMTPLHRAASKGKELTCNLLIRRGSNQQAEDDSGRTPADWARKRGFKHLSQKLKYRRKSSTTLLAEDDEKQCLEHLHRLHEAALKVPSQYPEPMDCEK